MKKYFKNAAYSLLLLGLFLSSCVPLKDFVYLQGDPSEADLEITNSEAYRMQPNDNLYIQVISNDELSTYFNLSSTDRYLNNDAAIEISSYKVDANGEIDFPYIGSFKVQGLTTQEIKEIISKNIAEKLVQYSVVVKLVNRSVTLLGEFNNPGTFSFYKDKMTIFEAMGLGKDLTNLANRHKVKVIRRENGIKKIGTLDMTSNDVLKSEFYYILPNDIIYVEPSHKFYQSKGLSIANTALSTFTTFVNLYFIFDRITSK